MRKKTQWTYRKFGQSGKRSEVSAYAEQLGVSEPVAAVLLNRDLDSQQKAATFFNPSLEDLRDPALLADIDKAVARVAEVIRAGESLLIFGDYDVDGTAGTALLTRFFQENNVDVHYYIPDRETEGYGLSRQGIDRAHELGVGLIITCDCGINAFEEISYANSLNIPMIITDHHRPAETLPDAFAVLNPKRTDCDYPFEGLCGSAVAFKFALAMCRTYRDLPDLHMGEWSEERLFSHLDLVALATAADMVPVTGENRVLVSEGLRYLQNSRKPGIQALISVSGLQEKLRGNRDLNVGNIVFQIAPRINAVGRLGSASRAVELLVTENRREAEKLARVLDDENTARRGIEQETFEAAVYQVQSKYPDLHRRSHRALVLWDEGWHQGVIGIVASKLKEKYHLPVVVIAINNGIGKGSARSIDGFDLYDAFSECSDHFTGFGGHAMAAGLTISPDSLESFEQAFHSVANREISDEMLVPELTLETDIRFTHVNNQLMEMLQRLGPYGPQNMRPVFGARKLSITGMPRIVGDNHLKFKVKQGRSVLDAIAFRMGEYYELLIKNEPVDLAFVVEKNEWNNRVYTQLNIRDIALSKENSPESTI